FAAMPPPTIERTASVMVEEKNDHEMRPDRENTGYGSSVLTRTTFVKTTDMTAAWTNGSAMAQRTPNDVRRYRVRKLRRESMRIIHIDRQRFRTSWPTGVTSPCSSNPSSAVVVLMLSSVSV